MQSLGLQKWMPKATWKKDAKKCAKKRFGLEIWCSWLRFRRPGARPGRPKSGPRRPQHLSQSELRALRDALGRSWALFCFFLRFCLNFGQFFVDFCYRKVLGVGFSCWCCLLLAAAQLEFEFKISSCICWLLFACACVCTIQSGTDFELKF